MADPLAFHLLLTFKQFTDLQSADKDAEDVLRSFNEYKRKYTAAHLPKFYETHHAAAW